MNLLSSGEKFLGSSGVILLEAVAPTMKLWKLSSQWIYEWTTWWQIVIECFNPDNFQTLVSSNNYTSFDSHDIRTKYKQLKARTAFINDNRNCRWHTKMLINLTQVRIRTMFITKHERDQRKRTTDLRKVILNKTQKQDNAEHRKTQIL